MLTSHEHVVLKEVHLKSALAQQQLNLVYFITSLLLKPFVVNQACQQEKTKLKSLSALHVGENKPKMKDPIMG